MLTVNTENERTIRAETEMVEVVPQENSSQNARAIPVSLNDVATHRPLPALNCLNCYYFQYVMMITLMTGLEGIACAISAFVGSATFNALDYDNYDNNEAALAGLVGGAFICVVYLAISMCLSKADILNTSNTQKQDNLLKIIAKNALAGAVGGTILAAKDTIRGSKSMDMTIGQCAAASAVGTSVLTIGVTGAFIAGAILFSKPVEAVEYIYNKCCR